MTLRTCISIDECKARLATAIDVERFAFSWSGYAGSKDILGKIRDTSFRLQKRRYYRNSFAPFFFGRFVVSDGGTLIEGDFKMHPAVKVFLVIWFSFLAFFVLMTVTLTATGRAHMDDDRGLALVIPFGMAIFAVALVKFGQRLGRSEEQAILAFLKSALEASDST
jgi:hypothetical protein